MSKTEKELLAAKFSSDENIYKAAEPKLASGLLNVFEKPLKNVEKQLKEVENTQVKILEKIHNENSLIKETQKSIDSQALFDKMKLYHNKLKAIKRDMRDLHEKSTKLKKRALKLQQIKESQEGVDEIIINSVPGTSSTSGNSGGP